MTRTLDKSRPYGNVFGEVDGVTAIYEQDGCLYNGQGELVRDADGSVPAKSAVAKPAPAVATAEVADEHGEDEPAGTDRRAQLEALHAKTIASLVEEQGMTPAEGAGSKLKNIDMLMAVEG